MTISQSSPAAAAPSAGPGSGYNALAGYNPWVILGVLCLGFFMILLDVTIVNIAVPSIVDAVRASFDDILWVIDAYILVYAVLLISAGRLGDMYGQRTLFAIGLAIFTAASALCGISQNTGELIAARMVQGVGGALLTPQTLAILTTVFPPERRGAAFGVWGSVAGLASISGPLLGGLLVTTLGWRAIFFVNVPIGIAAIAAAFFVMPDIRPGRHQRLDLGGVLLATLGLLGVLFGLIEGERFNWSTIWGPVTIPLVIAVGLAILVVFVFWERRQASPLIPFALLHMRTFVMMNLVLLAMLFAMLGLFLPLTIYFQTALGMTALQAGLTTVPLDLTSGIFSPLVGRAIDRFGGKRLLIAGVFLFCGGIGLVLVLASPTSTRLTFVVPFILAGLGEATVWGPSTVLAMQDVEPRLAGSASGLLNTTRQIGAVLGSAVVGALLQNRLAAALYEQAQAAADQIPAALRQEFLQSFAASGQAGLEVGPTQALVQLPPDVSPDLAAQIQQLAHDVFAQAFVTAMRPSLAVPLMVLLVAGLAAAVTVRERPARLRPGESPVGH